MSANALRQAAAAIRALSGNATEGPWEEFMAERPDGSRYAGINGRDPEVDIATFPLGPQGSMNSAYITALQPDVGATLANWLDEIASFNEQAHARLVRDYGQDKADQFVPDIEPHALAVAKLINRSAT